MLFTTIEKISQQLQKLTGEKQLSVFQNQVISLKNQPQNILVYLQKFFSQKIITLDTSHFTPKQTCWRLFKRAKSFNTFCLMACSYHVKHAFQSESTLCSCLNVKGLLAWNRRHIWSFSDCNGTLEPITN